MLKTLLATPLIVFSFVAFMNNTEKATSLIEDYSIFDTLVISGEEVDIYSLGDYYLPTTTAPHIDDFASFLAPHLFAMTSITGFETCALICQSVNQDRWFATVTTINSKASCPVVNHCPENYESTGLDIHSHIHESSYNPNEIDKLFLSGEYSDGEMVHTTPDEFSNADFAYPGFMVGIKNLYFQDGVDNVKTVSPISR